MALSSVAALQTTAKPNITLAGVTIKQERPDEAEIRELAAKMVEANKAKAASAANAANAANAARPAGQGPMQQQQIVQPGQPGIINFLTRGPNVPGKPCDKDKSGNDPDKKPACDEDSVRGRFGWVTLGKCHIPFIFRNGEKYCAVRMVEMKLLSKYLNNLNPEVSSCTCIPSYYITEAEARLLNEVNIRHCEGQFGREQFTCKDLVVRLQDAGEFYNFLDICYNKIILSSSNPKDRCGFIRINGESVVPYTVRDGFKYVPLFYFEGETDNLKLKAEKLEGWDLAYLKFCCKVQGIRNELFASETCSVISLSDIKSYFPPGTMFEDYWPSKVVDNSLLLPSNKNSAAVTSAGMWTKQPPCAPPNHQPQQQQQHSTAAGNNPLHHQAAASNKIVSPPTQAVSQQRTTSLPPAPLAPQVNLNPAAVQAVCNGWAGLVGGQPAFQPGMAPQPNQVIRMGQPPISMHNLSPTNNSVSRAYSAVRPRPAPQYYPQVSLPMSSTPPGQMAVAQPPPLVRVTGAPPTLGSSCTYTSSTGHMPNVSQSSLHLMGLTDPSHHQMLPPPSHTSTMHSPHYTPTVMGSPQPQQRHTPPNNKTTSGNFPPPLIPVNGTSRYPSSGSATPSSIYGTGADVIDLSSPPQSPHRQAVGNGRSSSSTPTGNNDSGSPSGKKLIPISEVNTTGAHIPYQVQKALIDNKMVPCINSKPFIYSELLMTLPDLINHFFPSVSLGSCRHVLQEVLGLELYRGNRQQMTILRDSGKCQSVNDSLPLVQVRDVMQYMPQMKYILSRMSAGGEDNPSKRQRTS